MPMIFISMTNGSIAACKSHDRAVTQAMEMVAGEISRNCENAADQGECTLNLKLRTVYIEMEDK